MDILIEGVPPLEAVRKRPGMYVRGTGSTGVQDLLFDVVANAFDQYLMGRCSQIEIDLSDDRMFTVQDNGPGIPAHGSDRLPPLDHLFTVLSYAPTVDRRPPHVHVGRGALGVFVVTALSEHLEISTVHDGVEARASYARGQRIGPVATKRTRRASGTTLRFRPDSTLFTFRRSRKLVHAPNIEDLVNLSPGLSWHILGEKHTGRGLRDSIAHTARRSRSSIAYSKTADVEVALTWQSATRRRIASYVNYERTIGHGSHVDGLIDGVAEFLQRPKRLALTEGLVAAVSVMRADVTYGSPWKDRLQTPEARPAVAMATRSALEEWAAREPKAAAALRARFSRAGAR